MKRPPCAPYNAGMLREPVLFFRGTKVASGSGGFATTWLAIEGSPSRAYVKAMSGSERFAFDRVEAKTMWKVVVRYFPGLLESDSIIIRGVRCNIREIIDWEFRRQWLEIKVEVGVAQ